MKNGALDLKKKLDVLYARYNKKEYIDPDPLVFLYRYSHVRDREIAGLIASCLAYGRVEMIMGVVESVLDRMGSSPRKYLAGTGDDAIDKDFSGFQYRFAKHSHLSALLRGMKGVIQEHGSIENCVARGVSKDGLLPGLALLRSEISLAGDMGHLMADPMKTSACKRIHLFLRWMVRQDGVDPGGWTRVLPEQLCIPLDTHMFKIGTLLGFTQRKNADKKCVLEITNGFRGIEVSDPVKYDFSLTRFGIRRNMKMDELREFLEIYNG